MQGKLLVSIKERNGLDRASYRHVLKFNAVLNKVGEIHERKIAE